MAWCEGGTTCDCQRMRYQRPSLGRALITPPVLESWDKAGSPSQVRLDTFLGSVSDWFKDLATDTPLALGLDVALPQQQPLISGGHDLDNYLFPIVRRYGHQHFFAVFGRKTHGTNSTLAVEPLVLLAGQHWSPRMTCRAPSSGPSPEWKQEVAAACAAAAPARPIEGPIALQIHYRLSASYAWR
jgi:hypothetical protein